jgi:type IV pilus assembly protein PilM
MFGSGKSIVGLDIGSSSIKAIELKRSKGEIVVTHLGVEPLASDIVVDSMIVDSGSVSSAISKIFGEHGIKTKNVATSVSGHSVIVKKISVQPMSEGELAESITTEAAQHIPFDIADVNVDFDILNPDDPGPQMDVLLVAVKKDKILNYTNVLSLAGKSPAELLRIQLPAAPRFHGGPAEPGRQRNEHQHRERHIAAVYPRCERWRQPVHRFPAERT